MYTVRAIQIKEETIVSKATKQKETTEKVMTKYDRKMERRRKEQEQEAKAQKRMKICGTVFAICIIALIVEALV